MTVKKYRKRPVVIEAIQFTGKNPEELRDFCPSVMITYDGNADKTVQADIPTLEGVMAINIGDYVIKGVQGEHYPCKPGIFAATYESVDEQATLDKDIEGIIETLCEGDEVTLILKNEEQVTGLYRGRDDETIILRAKSGNAPDLGWNINAIEDIVPCDVEPAGEIVKVDFTDVKTGRKVVVNIDLTGEQAVVKAEFIPAAHREENGWYIHFASKFLTQLTGCEDSDKTEE